MMRDPARCVRRGAVAAGVLAALGAAYHILLRPRMLRWGATREEARRSLAGDAIVPDTVLDSTRAITIDAPSYLVWPWIAQIGYGRGGWYSYDRFERLVLAGRSVEGRSATRIHPELQDVRAGDEIRISAPVKATVVSVEPERHLVLGDSWAFVLEDLHDGRTRLLVRTRGWGWVRRPVRRVPVLRELGAAIDYLVGEPLHHVMERKMLLGIKERAEHAATASVPL